MTTESDLPDPDHVVRYCSFMRLREDGTPSGAAFIPNPGEDYVSVFWLEYVTSGDRLDEIRKRMTASGITLRSKGKLATIGVGRTRSEIRREFERELSFVHKPSLDDGSFVDDAHAGIYGLLHDDLAIGDYISSYLVEMLSSAKVR